VVTTAVAALASCSRFKSTDDLRAELRGESGDSTFMRYPCQSLVVDEFGWTLDSLDGVKYRLHPSMQRFGLKTFRDAAYRSRSNRNFLRISLPQQTASIYPYAKDLRQYRREVCSVNERAAEVVTGMRNFNFETTVLWEDIGDGRQLVATATARTLEELQVLRGTLFTMRFPYSEE
jgi:hypothetical protein